MPRYKIRIETVEVWDRELFLNAPNLNAALESATHIGTGYESGISSILVKRISQRPIKVDNLGDGVYLIDLPIGTGSW
jgi:hypothetical protein